MSQRFDQFFFTICKQVGGIEGFVRSFFDFMFRKTDFFYECDPGDKMGFPPGYNKKLIFGIMEQFQQEHYKKIPQKSQEEFQKKLEAAKAKQHNVKPVQNNQNKQIASKVQTVQKKEQVVKKVQQKKKQAKQPIISTYNGGTNQKYSWSQQIREVQVTIQIESSITSKNITVQLKNDHISIKKKTGETVIDGILVERINSGDSVWKIEKSAGKSFIVLNLQKAEEKIWSTVFKGDPEIDTTKVNNTKPLQQFDQQTQGAIRKLMYEQQRKQMGLPTTEEETQMNALKQAWDAQGSPFKGQPYNPNLINFSNQPPPM